MKKILFLPISLFFTVLFFYPIFFIVKKIFVAENEAQLTAVSFVGFVRVCLAFFFSYIFSVLLTKNLLKESGPNWQITIESEEEKPPSIKEIIEPVVLEKIYPQEKSNKRNKKGKTKV